MKKYILSLIIIFLLKITINSQVANIGNVWIVAVNIYHYQNTGILTNLNYNIYSAYELAMLYDSRQLTYSPTIILIDSKAKRLEILKILESTFVNNSELTNNDMIIFYFSGHGEMAGDHIGICPYDYNGKVRDLIDDDTLLDILNRSKARHKVCFIESCKTEAQSQAIYDPSILDHFNQERLKIGNGLVFITSTQAGEKSWGNPSIGGYFSHYLINGLKGEADINNDGFVSVKELFPFIQNGVKEITQNQQLPQINNVDGYDPLMPLIVTPLNKHEEPILKIQPVKEPCVINQTGTVCVENALPYKFADRWVTINNLTTRIPPGQKECFFDVKAGTLTFRILDYAPGGGSYTLGGESGDYQIQVKACDTVTKIIH